LCIIKTCPDYQQSVISKPETNTPSRQSGETNLTPQPSTRNPQTRNPKPENPQPETRKPANPKPENPLTRNPLTR